MEFSSDCLIMSSVLNSPTIFVNQFGTKQKHNIHARHPTLEWTGAQKMNLFRCFSLPNLPLHLPHSSIHSFIHSSIYLYQSHILCALSANASTSHIVCYNCYIAVAYFIVRSFCSFGWNCKRQKERNINTKFPIEKNFNNYLIFANAFEVMCEKLCQQCKCITYKL